jgi:serine/threonine-protein kinase RsbW
MGVAGSNRRGDGGRRRQAGSPPAGSPPSRRDGHGANNGGAGGFRVTIPSEYGAGRDVQERILRDVEQSGFSTDNAFAIRIALEEAMVNAIKHGNRMDRTKKVHVEARVTPKRAEITIEDEGAGFDRGAIPDPTDESNLDKPSGRGILLIEAYMDGVEWSRGGRRLRMVKENQA